MTHSARVAPFPPQGRAQGSVPGRPVHPVWVAAGLGNTCCCATQCVCRKGCAGCGAGHSKKPFIFFPRRRRHTQRHQVHVRHGWVGLAASAMCQPRTNRACCPSSRLHLHHSPFNRCGGCWPRPEQPHSAGQPSAEAAESSDGEAGWEEEEGERPAKGSGGKAAAGAQQAQQVGWVWRFPSLHVSLQRGVL